MASELSDYLANANLNWLRGVAFPSAPADVYMALFNGNPTSGGSEVTATIRAAGRVAIDYSVVASRAIENATDVDYGEADAGATVNYLAVYDAASSGNLLGYSPLDNARTIVAGDPVLFLAGAHTFHFN
jgi:hypothetical protein